MDTEEHYVKMYNQGVAWTCKIVCFHPIYCSCDHGNVGGTYLAIS